MIYLRSTLFILSVLLWSCTAPQENKEVQSEPKKTFNVMAPLHIKVFNDPRVLEEADWEKFKTQLAQARDIGVAAVSVDVWWGDVEGEADNSFNWTYYQDIFKTITDHDLQVIPILSFHQCGGNSGDDYTSLLPNWIWSKLMEENDQIASELDLKYISDSKDEDGDPRYSNEFVALWADDLVMDQYIEFMEAFKAEFAAMFDQMQEINISCGPAGELRYPSYNSHDNWSYPGSGNLQCYSDLALSDFQKASEAKYGTIQLLNGAWNTDFSTFGDITLPEDAEDFFQSGAYYNTTYGKDFISWYNQSLVDHGVRMVKAGLKTFGDQLSNDLKLGFKVPGIHWQLRNPQSPRASEVKCGLINSYGLTGAKGYHSTLSRIYEEIPNDKVNLHFTCLEMGNEYSGEGESEHYSRAQELVFQVDSAAQALGINVKGENALAGNLYGDFGWDRMAEALDKGTFEGVTILRMGDVTTENELGKKRYTDLISKNQ